jgi:hypothetical protein
MHLAGTGIGEAGIDAAGDERPHETFRTVHSPPRFASELPY